MTLAPKEPEEKYCFTYCGDDRCTCQARDAALGLDLLIGRAAFRRRQHEEDARRSRKITDRGGIDGTVRPSDRIEP